MPEKKVNKRGTPETLLVELLTEELPPKSLKLLSDVFADGVFNSLVKHQLNFRVPGWRVFATPRRLGMLLPEIYASAPDRTQEVTGPSVKAPPEAVAGFARKHGVAVDQLQQVDTPKGKVYACETVTPGAQLNSVLSSIVEDTLKRLPIPKAMRWGNGDTQFARPVHGLVMLHGSRIVPG
ncbi:MAG TPA: glycine--tRNA ligase subunit beta, partial [Burkholderiales bacterium]|nr:glycine--tRNA ligase subunit beta [Burkholderiales bacterium]